MCQEPTCIKKIKNNTKKSISDDIEHYTLIKGESYNMKSISNFYGIYLLLIMIFSTTDTLKYFLKSNFLPINYLQMMN